MAPEKSNPFLIFSLPRSRTAWLARYLTYGDFQCGHDELRHCRSMDDVKSWFSQPCTGTVETAAAPFWRLLARYAPDARIAVVRRPVPEVVDSLMRTGLPFEAPKLMTAMQRFDRKLDQIERRLPGVLSVTFADLACEQACGRIFEHCLPYQHDPGWWQAMAAVNIQINLWHLMRYWLAHADQLAKLAATAKHQALAWMARGEGAELDGMTLQQEPFETFYRDGQALFAEHLVQVGEDPGAYVGKNLELMRTLEQIGGLQITTARSNGRMFGYLMTVISPSLESPDLTSAINTTFYASPTIRGLGLKLQRASLEALRGRGVDEVLFRAGTRGSGPKMGALYRRLGARDNGQLFHLELEGT